MTGLAIGRIHEILHHNMTLEGHRLEQRCRRPWGDGCDYPDDIWKEDEALFELRENLQDWLTMHAGPVDGISEDLLTELKAHRREALAKLKRAQEE